MRLRPCTSTDRTIAHDGTGPSHPMILTVANRGCAMSPYYAHGFRNRVRKDKHFRNINRVRFFYVTHSVIGWKSFALFIGCKRAAFSHRKCTSQLANGFRTSSSMFSAYIAIVFFLPSVYSANPRCTYSTKTYFYLIAHQIVFTYIWLWASPDSCTKDNDTQIRGQYLSISRLRLLLRLDDKPYSDIKGRWNQLDDKPCSNKPCILSKE